jgi:hypothetical protein
MPPAPEQDKAVQASTLLTQQPQPQQPLHLLQSPQPLSPPPEQQLQQQQQQQQQRRRNSARRSSHLYLDATGTLSPAAQFTETLVRACQESIAEARAAAGLATLARLGEAHEQGQAERRFEASVPVPSVDESKMGSGPQLEPGDAAIEESREAAAAAAAATAVLERIAHLLSMRTDVVTTEAASGSATVLRGLALRTLVGDDADMHVKHVLMPVMQPCVFDYRDSAIRALLGSRAHEFALRVVKGPAYKVSLSVLGPSIPVLILMALARVAPHWLAFAGVALAAVINNWQLMLLNTQILGIFATNFTMLFTLFNAILASVAGLFVWADVEDTRLWAASLVLFLPNYLFDAAPLSERGRRRLGLNTSGYLIYCSAVLALAWFGYFETQDREVQLLGLTGGPKISTLRTFLSSQLTQCIMMARASYRFLVLGEDELIMVSGIKKVAMPRGAARELIALFEAERVHRRLSWQSAASRPTVPRISLPRHALPHTSLSAGAVPSVFEMAKCLDERR